MEIRHIEPYQKITDACQATGLSQFFLRKGCQDGTVPHIRSGKTYYINVPALLDKLAAQQGKGSKDIEGQDETM